MALGFTGERIVPGAVDCEPTFAQKMYQEHIARYAFAAQLANGADVLDVGCGVGYGSQWLAKSGAKSVRGFDLSEEAVDHARMHYFHPAVSYKVQDAHSIEAGDGYDLVTCFELIEHIDRQEEVLDLIKGALRPDGSLVISTPRPLDDIRTHFHVHEMTFEELYNMLKARFKHVKAFFEVNCFTSFVGERLTDKIGNVIPVSNRIDMGNADYFVFVASDREIDEALSIDPVLSVNDDSYVLNLEKDVGVLRKAENDHLARIAHLERENVDGIAALMKEKEDSIAALVAEKDSIVAALTREKDDSIAALEKEKVGSVAALAKERSDAFDQLHRVRQNLAEVSDRLSGAETDLFRLRGDAERLPEALDRANALEAELNSLRYRFAENEATLNRFRRSLSWKITTPIRWIGRTYVYRKLLGRASV